MNCCLVLCLACVSLTAFACLLKSDRSLKGPKKLQGGLSKSLKEPNSSHLDAFKGVKGPGSLCITATLSIASTSKKRPLAGLYLPWCYDSCNKLSWYAGMQCLAEAQQMGLKYYVEKAAVNPAAVVAGGGEEATDDEDEEADPNLEDV